MDSFFRRFAHTAATAVGRPWAFFLAVGAVVAWALAGAAWGYSDRWQLVINTATTIVTFLMVFLIQNTQNREAKVTQLKLDELIRSLEQARNRLVAMEEMSDEELQRIEREFHELHASSWRIARRTGEGALSWAQPSAGETASAAPTLRLAIRIRDDNTSAPGGGPANIELAYSPRQSRPGQRCGGKAPASAGWRRTHVVEANERSMEAASPPFYLIR